MNDHEATESHLTYDDYEAQVRLITSRAKRNNDGETRAADHETRVVSWDPPVPLTQFNPPPFPTSVLPTWLRDYVEAEATATQTPPDLAAMLTLTVCAAAIAKKVEVLVKEGYKEPVNIYMVIALEPANRKSAVYADVADPLEEFEQSETQRLSAQILRPAARLQPC
ncbi:MAG: DUF3987 domain-containing protein [Candidatus Eisenbacteria bacterium]